MKLFQNGVKAKFPSLLSQLFLILVPKASIHNLIIIWVMGTILLHSDFFLFKELCRLYGFK